MQNTKVCFFNSCKVWGGGEKWHFETAQLLQKDQISVIVASNQQSELYQKAIKSAIPVHQFSISNLSFLNPFAILKICNFFKKEQISTVILNLPADLKVAGIAAKLVGVSNVIYRRGSAIKIKNSFLNRFLFKNVITSVIANSNETKKTILANNSKLISSEKIHVIYNSFNLLDYEKMPLDLLYKREKNELIIGNAGRMVAQKNQYDLLKMAAQLKEKKIQFKLLIAGDGKLMPELLNYADELKISEHIVFLGFVENIRSFMESIDIFVLTSKWEGFGYVLAEAMASQKPVVAFNISSNPEIVANNETGYLIDSFDINAMAAKVELLINNQLLCSEMGKKGYERVKQEFSIDVALKALKGLI